MGSFRNADCNGILGHRQTGPGQNLLNSACTIRDARMRRTGPFMVPDGGIVVDIERRSEWEIAAPLTPQRKKDLALS